MEAKKNPDKDVNRKSGQFFLIGLSISTSIMIMAFEWKTEVIPIPFSPSPPEATAMLPEIPNIKVKLPKPTEELSIIKPKTSSTSFTPVPVSDSHQNENKKNPPTIEADSLAFNGSALPMFDVPEVDTSFFVFVEEAPEPVGGFKSFYKSISERVKYPAQARRIGTEGKVYVEFIISKKGEPTDLKIVKGIGAGCDEEALRVLALLKWQPGKQRGMPVRVKMVMPVYFKLGM